MSSTTSATSSDDGLAAAIRAQCRLYARTAGASFANGAWGATGVGGGESKLRISACK